MLICFSMQFQYIKIAHLSTKDKYKIWIHIIKGAIRNVAPEIVVGLLRESEKYLHKQQTPNPDAHVPDAVPPNFEQSDEL